MHESGSAAVRTTVEVSTEGGTSHGQNAGIGVPSDEQTASVEGAVEVVTSSTSHATSSQAFQTKIRFEVQSLLATFFSRIKTYVFAFFTW